MPLRVWTPDRVRPSWQYAVAVTRIDRACGFLAGSARAVAIIDRQSTTAPAMERMRRGFQLPCRGARLGRASHLKNRITSTAGMNGPHQWSSPNALSVVDPNLTKAMMAPAHANALTRFR